MKKAVIIEDELASRKILKNFLSKYPTGISLVGEATNVEEGVIAINEHQPDLIFSDINLPDGTGFDVLDQCQPLNATVIFITAYDQYAIKAFKYSAIEYLLKPFDPMELMAAINRFLSQELQVQQLAQKTLLENKDELKKVALSTAEGMRVVEINEIIYCEADNNYTTVVLENNDKIMLSKTLKHFENLLPEDIFYRCHQSFIINISKIDSYTKRDGGVISMKVDKKIPVARRKKEGLESRIQSNIL